MTLRLTVAPALDALADALADDLARPLDDPFAGEVVAVPGDGTRSWLTARLASRLGASDPDVGGDGIVANVEFVFPATLVRRALGERRPVGPWSVGPLTWAVAEVLAEHGDRLGVVADAVRCRAIADLFDRYALRRPAMVRAWERGVDVDAAGSPLPEHLRWQPQLWRALLDRLGPSDAQAMALAHVELRAGRTDPLLPPRVFLFGLASLPVPHLQVLTALSTRLDVHVLVPTPSLELWHGVRRAVATPLALPVARAADPSADVVAHPLARAWSRAPREAVLLLADAVEREAAAVELVDTDPVPSGDDAPTLLARVQGAIRGDVAPVGPPVGGGADERPVVDPDDRSIRWHRCHGPARQVEVLRDALVHLLEEREPDGAARFEPRDIAVLCPDVATFAPLVEAAFAGDPEHGVPRLPVRVADRTLRQDAPLLDAVVALLELVDARVRASSVLGFAARLPVRRRFGFGPDELGTLAAWVERTNVRWGIEPADRARFGVPAEITTHTWQAGLDQLLVGAAMADTGPRLGPGGTVPYGDVEGDDVELAGALADLVHRLGRAVARLTATATVHEWCDALAASVAELCAVPDAESWQWLALERTLAEFAGEAVVAGSPSRVRVPALELASLLVARLTGPPGRARFGTGAITMSSLTAQRGVPHRVVCLLGLDGDVVGTAPTAADDLVAAAPCVGDPEPRAELRAQLLDALLAAGERLVICSTGSDVRTNAPVPPAVPLAELADLLDLTARGAGQHERASAAVTVVHPRQAWSERNFVAGPGRSGPWSFDRAARAAAVARRAQHVRPPFLREPLPDDAVDEVTVDDLVDAVTNPVKTLLTRRLGVWLARSAEPVDDLVPLAADALGRWRLADELLRACLAAGDAWDDAAARAWEEVQRRAGHVAPLGLADADLDVCRRRVDALLATFRAGAGPAAAIAPATVDVDVAVGDRRLTGQVAGVRGDVLTEVVASQLGPRHQLQTWVRLAALAHGRPGRVREAVLVGRAAGADAATGFRFRLRDGGAAEAVSVVTDLAVRARRDVVPFFPATSSAVHVADRSAAEDAWRNQIGGDGDDPWVRFALGVTELDDLMAEPPRPDERGDGWPAAGSRLEVWARRVWATLESTTEIEPVDVEPVDAEPVDIDAGSGAAGG